MGCGSSNDAVKTFNNDENRSYQTQQAGPSVTTGPRAVSASSKKSRSSIKSSTSGRKKARKYSSASSRSDTVHDFKHENDGESDTKRQADAGVAIGTTAEIPPADKEDSTLKKQEETIKPESIKGDQEDTSQQLVIANTIETEKDLETKNISEPEEPFKNKSPENVRRSSHGTLGEDPFKKRGNYVDADRAERHERLAAEKEERRASFDYDLRQQEEFERIADFTDIDMNGLQPVPEHDVPSYTNDDIDEHNESNPGDWFKYGRKVYSNFKFWPIVQQRVAEYQKLVMQMEDGGVPVERVRFPVQKAASNGVPRKDIRLLLTYCLVGHWEDVSVEVYRDRMKQSAEFVLEEMNGGSEEFSRCDDYKGQVTRWISSYPEVKRENKLADYSMDPNEISFPLPDETKNAPNTLRHWIETYEPFDTEVPTEGGWTMTEKVGDELGDTHAMFAKMVAEGHAGDSMDDFDMVIDGEAGWNIIELELFKNGVTTETQEQIWKLRELRTNLNNAEWMESRRKAIADSLTQRHEWTPDATEPYLQFAERLEAAWKAFQELVDNFIPRMEKQSDMDQMPDEDNASQNAITGDANPQNHRVEEDADNVDRLVNENNDNGENVARRPSSDRSSVDGHQDLSGDDGMHGDDSPDRRPKSGSVINDEHAQEPLLDSMDSGLDMVTGEQVDHDSNVVRRSSDADVRIERRTSN